MTDIKTVKGDSGKSNKSSGTYNVVKRAFQIARG